MLIQIHKKLKADWKFFSWAWSKNGFDQYIPRILKLTVSQEWTDGINLFLRVDKVSQKSKADQKFIEWACSKKGVASLVTGL